MEGIAPDVFGDIEALRNYFDLEGVVPQVYGDIQVDAGSSFGILAFPQRSSSPGIPGTPYAGTILAFSRG